MNLEQYKEILETEKYSKNTIKNWMYYAAKFDGQEITQESIYKFIRDHNNKFARAFLGHYLNAVNIRLAIPKIKGRESPKEVEYLEKEEIDRLKRCVDDKLKIMISLMFESGLRISEVMNLEKKDIKMVVKDHKVVGGNVVGVGKGRAPFNQPITERTAKDILLYLSKVKEGDKPFIWDSVNVQRQKAIYELRKSIKAVLGKETHCPCHIFRHSCGTYLKYSGWDLRDIQVFLRHKHLQTVEGYTAVKKDVMISSWKDVMGKNVEANREEV